MVHDVTNWKAQEKCASSNKAVRPKSPSSKMYLLTLFRYAYVVIWVSKAITNRESEKVRLLLALLLPELDLSEPVLAGVLCAGRGMTCPMGVSLSGMTILGVGVQ